MLCITLRKQPLRYSLCSLTRVSCIPLAGDGCPAQPVAQVGRPGHGASPAGGALQVHEVLCQRLPPVRGQVSESGCLFGLMSPTNWEN